MNRLRPCLQLCLSFIFIFSVLLSGCGGGDSSGGSSAASSTNTNTQTSPPVLSELVMVTPAVAQGVSGSTGTIEGNMRFSDTGGDLATGTVRVYNSSGVLLGTSTSPLQGLTGQVSGYLTLAGTIPRDLLATYTFRITAIDSTGAVSNEVSATVQVVPSNQTATVVATTGLGAAYLTAIGSDLYWTERGQDILKSVSNAGGSVNVRATKMTNPTSMAFVGSDLIWLDAGHTNSPWTNTCDPASRAVNRTNAAGITTLLGAGPACNTVTTDIVVDGGTVYWGSTNGVGSWGSINATPIAGGTTQTLFSSSSAAVVALAGQPGTLYWMDRISSSTADGAIHSVPTAGGAATTLVSGINVVANTFAVDDTAIYYASSQTGSSSGPSTLWAKPLSGAQPIALATSLATPLKIIVASGKVVWIDAASVRAVSTTGGAPVVLATTANTPVSVMVNGTNVVWSESTGAVHGETGSLNSVPLAGGAVTTLYQGSAAPRQLALDDVGQVIWSEGGAVGLAEGFARIARLTTGNVVQTVLAGIANEAARFVTTGTDLYIADGWQIKRVPLTGGFPEVVASNDGPILFLAVDSTSVYWTSANDASVKSAPLTGGIATTLISSAMVGNQAISMGNLRVGPNGSLMWGVYSPYIRRIVSIPSNTISTVASTIADITDFPKDILVDSSNVYFGPTAAGILSKVSISGGTVTSLTAMNNVPATLVLDGSLIYWLNATGITKVPVTGGANTSVMLLTGNSGNYASNLTVDSSRVYWTDSTTQQILTVSK